jgi:DNA-binding response OmpR family regulator
MNTSASKVLIVDDEREITELIALYLQRDGFDIHVAHNGEDALRIADLLDPDLVILDISLGRMDGIEVCRRLRRGAHADVPIVFLSCKGEDADIVRGLSEGGDDYITKPFSPSQLVARVHAHLRRRRMHEKPSDESTMKLCYKNMEIDLRRLEVRLNGERLNLSVKEFELLLVLAREPNRVFPLEELYRRVWQSDSMGDTRTLMVHISNLRKKLEEDPSSPRWIHTVRGFGYRFTPEDDASTEANETA